MTLAFLPALCTVLTLTRRWATFPLGSLLRAAWGEGPWLSATVVPHTWTAAHLRKDFGQCVLPQRGRCRACGVEATHTRPHNTQLIIPAHC